MSILEKMRLRDGWGKLPEDEIPVSWRDQLSLRLARVFAVIYLTVTLLISMTMHGRLARPVMTAVGILCFVLVGIPAATGCPKSKGRAWLVVISAVIGALAGYSQVGFLSGPAVVLTLTIMLAGLLLGSRVMWVLLAFSALGLGFIAWSMIHALLPPPDAQNVSMTQAVPWIRTTVLTFLAIGPLGGLMIEIVARMERSLEQARRETRLREQAERAKAEAEIRSLENKQLETIGRLAAGVAHDFNNNLTAIIGCAELLKDECPDKPSAIELTEDILKTSRRAAELTRQLLAYSRKAQIALAPTDIHKLIEKAVNLLRRSIDPRVQIHTQLNASTSMVLGDATLLDNALLNLLVNAGDAMSEGGQLTVATTTYEVGQESIKAGKGLSPGTYILVEVLDTGAGIEAEILPHIFDPFFTTKPLGKGTGLGLAAVSGTIRAHNGSIEAESEPGCGTVFRILLPCSAVQASSSDRPEGTRLIRGSGEVFLVDDDSLVRNTAAATLKNLGYSVTTATDGAHAVEVLEASPKQFGLVILDLRMPKMSGQATFDELRRIAPDLRILIWSGYGADQDVEALLQKGAVGFVQKPYRIAELSRVIYEAIHAPSVAEPIKDNN